MLDNMKQLNEENLKDPVFIEFGKVFETLRTEYGVELCDVIIAMMENDYANIDETLANEYPEFCNCELDDFMEKHYWSKGQENANLESYYTSLFGFYWNSDISFDNFDPKYLVASICDETDYPSRRKASRMMYDRIKDSGVIPNDLLHGYEMTIRDYEKKHKSKAKDKCYLLVINRKSDKMDSYVCSDYNNAMVRLREVTDDLASQLKVCILNNKLEVLFKEEIDPE